MAFKAQTRASGFSKRQEITLTREPSVNTKDVLQALASERGFEGLIRNYEAEFLRIFAEMGDPWEAVDEHGRPRGSDGEPNDYAAQFIKLLRLIRYAASTGAIDDVAQFSVRLGMLIREFELKCDYEPDAIYGQARKENLDKFAQPANEARARESRLNYSRWQREADIIWAEGAHKSKNQVAKVIIARLRLTEKVDTVARHIEKPRTAG